MFNVEKCININPMIKRWELLKIFYKIKERRVSDVTDV